MKKITTIAMAMGALVFVSASADAQSANSRQMGKRDQAVPTNQYNQPNGQYSTNDQYDQRDEAYNRGNKNEEYTTRDDAYNRDHRNDRYDQRNDRDDRRYQDDKMVFNKRWGRKNERRNEYNSRRNCGYNERRY